MERLRRIGFGTLFAIFLLALLTFLRLFTISKSPYGTIMWESACVSDANGAETPFDPSDLTNFPARAADQRYSFTATLSDVPGDGSLLFDYGGAEVTLVLSGAEIFRSTAPADAASERGWAHVLVPLTADAEGAELTMTLRLLPGEDADILPPFLRVVSNGLREAEIIANANLYAMPAGAFALALTLVLALFLLGLYEKKPDWKLLALVAALAALILRYLEMEGGLYFLPQGVYKALAGDAVRLVPTGMILLYMALCRDRASWRRLGLVSIYSAVALAAAYLISLALGGEFSGYINATVPWILRYGDWRTPVYRLTVFLVYAFTLLAAYGHISFVAATQAEAHVLAMKNELAIESCRAMEQSSRRTAELRHELKNQVAAMNALFAKGDMEGLGEYLKELDDLQGNLTPARYTEHFLVNAIVQNAAERAAESNVRFEARVNVPEEINIEERDLSALLMNMLDNALEAACRVESASRYVYVGVELINGFLAIRCENAYATLIKTDNKGILVTTKEDAASHGFGIRQMRSVAEKYQSILDVSYTDDAFTVQTALKTKNRRDLKAIPHK